MKRISIKPAAKSSKPDSDNRVKVVSINTRKLVIYTIGEKLNKELIKDSIVWVKPTARITPEELAVEVENIRKLGAVRVLPLPLEAQDSAIPKRVMDEDDIVEDVGIRESIELLLSNVKEQQEQVKEIIEDVLQEVGL